ncbi:MAG TPA: CPBP family intramembrane glutamic endopeptidase [Rhizomicrobium sp.]|nr:CPBP family intramembrane glutamic endopeptidase [Rhizomicrobium sp.]
MTETAPTSFRDSLRGYGPAGIVATLAIVAGVLVGPVIAAVLILIWAWASKTPWADIGYARPKSWIGGALLGIVLGVAFKLVMKAVVMPLLGAPPVNPAFHYMAGDLDAALEFAATVVLAVGWAEETVFRGWLFERFEKLLGRGAGATILIVLLTSALFGAAHYMGQGLPGVEQAAIVGFVSAAIYAVTRKLWMLIWMHTAFDLGAAAMIYLDAENQISHLVFK